MTVARLLDEIAGYWRVAADGDEFLKRLNDLHANYPRVFDAVEKRVFSQLITLVLLESRTDTSVEATAEWLKKLKQRALVEQCIADGKFSDANQAYLGCHKWWNSKDYVELVGKRKAKLQAIRQQEDEQRAAEKLKVRALVEAHRHAAEAEQEEAEAKRRKSASRQFDLLVFDLDDTLVKTTHLEDYRGRENVDNRDRSYIISLKEKAKCLHHLISEETLLEIKDTFPSVRLSVFTRAPRVYATTVLETCYPNVEWDSIVAFDDVKKTKPHPMGIWQAAESAGIEDSRRIAVVGDQKNDVLAAYQAGTFAILYTRAWGLKWKDSADRSDRYRAMELMPDAIVERPGEFIDLISKPWPWLPLLESCDQVTVHAHLKSRRSIDKRNHFNNLESTQDRKQWVEAFALGRYFTAHRRDATFDFSPRSDVHSFSLKILNAKDGEDYPDNWIACCAEYINTQAQSTLPFSEGIIVCPVPARPERPHRIERLVDRIAKAVGRKHGVRFSNDVLRFREGVVSNKTLKSEDRFRNIRDHLYVADTSAVYQQHVIVVDDVTTTGATFYYADRYLRRADASGVHCFSLAHAIS